MSASDAMLYALLRRAVSLHSRGDCEDASFLFTWIHTYDLRSRARTALAATKRRQANSNPRRKPLILESDPVGRAFLASAAGMEVGVRMQILIEKLRTAPKARRSAARRDLEFFCLEHPPIK